MRLMLADEAHLHRWMEQGVAKYTEFNAEEFEARSRDDRSYAVRGGDAVIPVVGPLSYKFDFWSWLFGGASYQGISSALAEAAGDEDIERVVMLFDTPGGEVTGVAELASQIAGFPKDIVAFVDPLCASAGLWLASQCNSIKSIESGEIGSLGVQAMVVSYAEQLKKMGVDLKVIRAAISPDKNVAMPYEPISDKAVKTVQERVDKWGERFVAAVASGRGVSEATVKSKFGKGKMFYADEATELGMIDGISTLSEELFGNKKRQRTKFATSKNLPRLY